MHTMRSRLLLSLVLATVPFLLLAKPIAISAVSTAPEAKPSESSTATPSPSSAPRVNLVEAPINLTLSPVTINLEVKPGEKAGTPLKIRNNGTMTENLKLSFGTFMADETGEKPRLLDPKTSDTFMQWVSADTTNFTIAPGEWKTITINFAPPADAALSYYYTIMVTRQEAPNKPGETAIQGAPAILMLTTVTSPNAKRELQLNSFTTPGFTEFLPQTFSLKIQNTGNVHVSPIGNIFIDGQNKKDLAVLSLNPANSTILPQSTRTLEVDWDDGFPIIMENGELKWDFEKMSRIRFGKYTAHVLMVYDNGQRDVPIESMVSFWVIPWRMILVAIAVPVVPSVIVFMIMRWYTKAQIRKYQKS